MKLYGYWRSTSSWRVRIALEWKALKYQNIPVHLVRDGGQQHSVEFREKNPLGQVPVLELSGASEPLRLSQSLPIIEYLEERFPAPPLFPAQAELRAHARELAEIVNSGIQPLQNLATLQQVRERFTADPQPWAEHFISKGLAVLESRLARVAGVYSLGAAVSVVDVFLVPQLANARRFGVDVGIYPTLRRIEQSCEVLEAFKRAHPSQQPDAEPQA